MTETERLQKENRALIKRNAHLIRINKRQRQQIETLRKQLNPDQQHYINVQRGAASTRRKGR